MAIQTVSQIKAWFRRRMYPTQEQFSDLLDSYYHKFESIAMSKVDGLMAALNLKQDKATDIVVDASTLESYDPTKIEGYQAGNVFVSYQNAFSTNPDLDFKELFIYQCVADAAMGESPETHPEKWTRIGKTMTYTSSTTATGWVGLMSQMYALTGMKDGHTVAVLQMNAVYKYSATSGLWAQFCELKPVVVQTTGNSTTAVMSQDATTKAIAAASGTGGGHVIKTTEVTLPQQPNLKIKGLPVTNNAAGSETVIDAEPLVARVAATEQDIADLQATSEANQLVLASIYGYYNYI